MRFHYESGLNPRLASNNGKFYLIEISRLCRECIVTDFDDHFPYDAEYELPPVAIASSVVVSLTKPCDSNFYLQRGFTALDTVLKDKQEVSPGDCLLELILLSSEKAELRLTHEAFSHLTAQYTFPLKTIAKSQQVQVQTAPINGLSSPVFFSLLAKSISETGGAIWTEQDKSEPACFALSSDGKTISLAKRGLYMVQLNGTMYEDDEGDGVRLLVNGKTISTATPKYIGWLYYVEISRLVTVSKPIDLTIQCCGEAIKDNYTLEVLLLQELCRNTNWIINQICGFDKM
ncbi:unnamed protein product [Aphanomyces euteiches]